MRFLVASAVGLLAAASAVDASLGSLRIDSAPRVLAASTSAALGPRFEFALETKGNASRIALYSTGKINKQLWESEFGKAFVGVGVSPPDVKHAYYGFEVTNPGLSTQSVGQSIQAIFTYPNGTALIQGDLILPSNSTIPYSVRIAPTNAKTLAVQVDVDVALATAAGINRLLVQYAADKDEEFFGFGQQFPLHLNMKGQRVPILVNEQGAGRGLEPTTTILNEYNNHAGGDILQTYAPMPHYQTSTLRALFLENAEYSVFDLTKNDTTRIEIAATTLKIQLFDGCSPLDLIETFTGFNGRMRKLPSWVSSGAIVGTQGGRAFVEDVYAKLKAVDAPVAAFWLQDWVGNRIAPWGKALWWNWEVDEKLYPNWPEFVSNLRKDNVRTLTYVNSHVGNIKGVKTDPEPNRFLYQELIENGFDVKDKDGNTQLSYQNASMFDLSNPQARVWIKDLIKQNILANNVSGYMCDFGEALQLDAKIFNGDAASFHNRYPEEWAKLNYEVVSELGLQDEILYFMRSGYTRSPQYTSLFWLGDQLQSWDEYDGLKNVVFASTVGGLSGIALTHADIGGYNYINSTGLPTVFHRTKKLFMRSAEFAAFTAAYRTHDGSSKDGAWQFYSDDETLTQFARNAKIYVAWGFYREQLIAEVVSKGYPLIRHLYLHYPEDPNVRGLKYQYLLGKELLVAPQVDEGKTEVSVYLPKGEWVHAWSDRVYEGPATVTIATPLGQPCVLYPQGSTVGKRFVANLKAAKLRV